MSAKVRHWADLGEVTFVAGTRLLFAVHRWLGNWPFRLCLLPVVLGYWALHAPARHASVDYLRRWQRTFAAAGPRPSSFRHFLRFADVLLDKLRAVSGRYPLEQIDVHGFAPVAECFARGQGALLVTAHVGCLELCQAAATAVPQLRITVLVHTRHAEAFNALLGSLRPDSSLRLQQVTELGPASAVDLAARVARGEFVAIVGDRVPVGAGRIARADLLGESAAFPVGPWVLASLLQCPVFLLSCVGRAQGGYRVQMEKVAERIVLPRRDREAVLAECVRNYAEWLQRLIASAPYEWFNFFDFWSQRGHESRSR